MAETVTAPEANTTTETILDLATVKAFLESNEDGKAFLNSYTDSKVTKALETFKVKTVPTLIEAEIAKRHPGETEQQKEFRALKAEFEQAKKEAQQEKLKNKAITHATEKNIPIEFLDDFIKDSEESTFAKLDAFGKFLNDYKSKVAQEKSEEIFKENGRTVTSDKDKKSEYADNSEEYYKNMTPEKFRNLKK